MKKISCLIILFFCTLVGLFAQETDNSYWYQDIDVNGSLVTYYMCKTDTQFNNTFKNLVKKQLEIQYSYQEPNWDSIQSGWISREGIRKNFPKFYKSLQGDNKLNWDNYKYCWTIVNINGVYCVCLFKRVNDTVYMTLNVMHGYYQWVYTSEVLTVLESSL